MTYKHHIKWPYIKLTPYTCAGCGQTFKRKHAFKIYCDSCLHPERYDREWKEALEILTEYLISGHGKHPSERSREERIALILLKALLATQGKVITKS